MDVAGKKAVIFGGTSGIGLAAAKQLDKPVRYETSSLTYNSQVVKPFDTALVRIDELITRDKIAAAKKIDFILDGSTSLLYGNPTYDLTDDVLFELRKYSVSDKDKQAQEK